MIPRQIIFMCLVVVSYFINVISYEKSTEPDKQISNSLQPSDDRIRIKRGSPQKPKICMGENNFKNFILNKCLYVDKTLLIKDLLRNHTKLNVICRPKLWGKSLNLHMLKTFFEIEVDEKGQPLYGNSINRKLFLGGEVALPTGDKIKLKPLKISKELEPIQLYQGSHPVILLNLTEVDGNDYQQTKESFSVQIKKMYEDHFYLLRHYKGSFGSRNKSAIIKSFMQYLQHKKLHHHRITESMRFLIHMLNSHFRRKVIILIDGYENVVKRGYINYGNDRRQYELLRGLVDEFMLATFESNTAYEFCIMTGILPLTLKRIRQKRKEYKEYFGLLGHGDYDVVDNRKFKPHYDQFYTNFYGFTHEEVVELLERIKMKLPMEKFKAFYNGYEIGEDKLYNPWSVMKCIENGGKIDQYWRDNETIVLIRPFIMLEDNQNKLKRLVAGKRILPMYLEEFDFASKPQDYELLANVLFRLMNVAGYLNGVILKRLYYDHCSFKMGKFVLPNEEIRTVLQKYWELDHDFLRDWRYQK